MNGVVLAFFLVIFESINCGPTGWIDDDSGDTKTKLTSLLASSNDDVHDISASNNILLKPPNYEPFYQSQYKFRSPQEVFDYYQPNNEDFNKNGKFAVPWLENNNAENNLIHKHGFHQGLWGFHHHHPDCFPFGNRRRPRPPVPPTTVAPSIDPRASTSAEFIKPNLPQTPLIPTTTIAPAGIDIRLGTDDDDDEAERIIFPDD
ncbi:unnamed protein product [Ceutorhynchus assimilis]|uniref:Uncharacterized protein n=1 Tax=Ceutorhynchus assimilis TaxID=467358 RepID=A0A9N9MGR0_9CUCU|nr:unnamed protein product [Ceutorhynchus assimilis]